MLAVAGTQCRLHFGADSLNTPFQPRCTESTHPCNPCLSLTCPSLLLHHHTLALRPAPPLLQDYIGETGELALSAVIAGVDTAVNEDGGILAKRERTEQVGL